MRIWLASFIPLTVGGGIRECQDIRRMLNAGADKVGINTAAIKNPHFVKEAADRFGSQCIVVAIDAKKSRGLRILDLIAGKSLLTEEENLLE